MRRLVKVTREHIRRGFRESPDHCPVALAIRDTCPELKNVMVTFDIFILNGNSVSVPDSVRSFIDRFDRVDQNGRCDDCGLASCGCSDETRGLVLSTLEPFEFELPCSDAQRAK